MEKRPATRENLNYRERLKLLSQVENFSNFYLEQLVAAPPKFQETFIPVLSITGAMMHEDLAASELFHLRKMSAIEYDVLRIIPPDAGNIQELRAYVGAEAITEVVEWRSLQNSDRKPQVWRNALTDVSKLNTMVSARLNQ